MPRSQSTVLVMLILLALPGCVARTVVSAATLPFKVAGKAVDVATTSQSEADQKRGRDLRLQEERLGRVERSYRQHSSQCSAGDSRSCELASADYDEIQRLSGGEPLPPR